MKQDRLYDLLERIANLLRAEAWRIGSQHELQPVQLQALSYLARCNALSNTPMAVAEYLGATKGTVSQTLKVLERKGLVEWHKDRQDRRISHFRPTAKGAAVVDVSMPPALFEQAAEALPQEAREVLEDSLEGLLRGLQAANAGRSFGVCRTCKHFRGPVTQAWCSLLDAPIEQAETERLCRDHAWPKTAQR